MQILILLEAQCTYDSNTTMCVHFSMLGYRRDVGQPIKISYRRDVGRAKETKPSQLDHTLK